MFLAAFSSRCRLAPHSGQRRGSAPRRSCAALERYCPASGSARAPRPSGVPAWGVRCNFSLEVRSPREWPTALPTLTWAFSGPNPQLHRSAPTSSRAPAADECLVYPRGNTRYGGRTCTRRERSRSTYVMSSRKPRSACSMMCWSARTSPWPTRSTLLRSSQPFPSTIHLCSTSGSSEPGRIPCPGHGYGAGSSRLSSPL
jgi:hypothetical protein